jgi:hypothetical protein
MWRASPAFDGENPSFTFLLVQRDRPMSSDAFRKKPLTNAQPRLTPPFTPAGRIADVHDTHISGREIVKTFQSGAEIGRARPGECGPQEDAGAVRRRHST